MRRNAKRACVAQLLASPVPRSDELARDVGERLVPVFEIALIAIAVLVGIAAFLLPFVLVFPTGGAIGIFVLAIVLGMTWVRSVTRRKRRIATRLAREGEIADVRPAPASLGKRVAGVAAALPLGTLGRAVAREAAMPTWVAEVGGREVFVRAGLVPPSARLLVHPELPIAALVHESGMWTCKVAGSVLK